jgi:hypothetical protein
MLTLKARIDGVPGSERTATIDTYLSRMAFFIHGTNSSPERWSSFDNTVSVLLRIANCSEPDIEFSWEKAGSRKLNGTLNNIDDRAVAANKLVKYVKDRSNECEDIVLIGHSHGGNVAIQAADRILEECTKIKHICILTVATPVFNSDYFYRKASTGKYIKKISEFPNTENPVHWKNKDKIQHISLYNINDGVDMLAFLNFREYYRMNGNTCTFEYDKGVNVAFQVDVKDMAEKLHSCTMNLRNNWLRHKELLTNLERAIREWEKTYSRLPQLPSFSEDEAIYRRIEKEMEKEQDARFHQAPVAVRDATNIARNPPLFIPDAFVLDEAVSVLFKDGKFAEFQDGMEKQSGQGWQFFSFSAFSAFSSFRMSKNLSAVSEQLTRISGYCNWLEARYKILSDTVFEGDGPMKHIFTVEGHEKDGEWLSSHSFDIICPKEIQKAIDDGRIIPFPRVIRPRPTTVSDKTR